MKRLQIILLTIFILSLSITVYGDDIFKIRASGNVTQQACNLTINEDTVISCPNSSAFLRGLSVTGTIVKSSPEYIVRVILKDTNGDEYLVMEAYDELYSEDTINISCHAEETCFLNCIQGDSLFIYVDGAVFQLVSVDYNGLNFPKKLTPTAYESRMAAYRSLQAQEKVNLINAYNESNEIYWWAGITDLSLKTYDERRRALSLPDNASSMGLEYYVGGLFEMGKRNPLNNHQNQSSKYVESFDWRNQHGRNWLTPVKDQGESGYCVAFADVGSLESLIKLYYNTNVEYDLSEQLLACECGDSNSWKHGIVEVKILKYLCEHGVCEEEAYPFINDSSFNCITDSISPTECVKITGYSLFSTSESTSYRLKDSLIHHGPLPCSYSWKYKEPDDSGIKKMNSHKVVLVGYGTVHAGDTICYYGDDSYLHSKKYINEGSPLIGQTYWIFKNSSGVRSGWRQLADGYQYIVFNDYNRMGGHSVMKVPVTTLSYLDTDISIEDADGDGYYFWGIGPKPAHAPIGIPDEADGDDSNSDYGPMNKYGYLKVLNPSAATTIMVNDSVTVDDTEYLYNHIQVNNNGVLTVETDTEFWGELKLTVKSGGTFIVDGIIIDNVELSLESGSHLIVKNGGTLKLRSGKSFYAPTGAIVDISSGNILP